MTTQSATSIKPVSATENTPSNFIDERIQDDLRQGKNEGRVVTRFPPEPNGYLHIGHAKSICLNFGLAKKYNGVCHLRFDDTNPETEEVEYVESIKEMVHWLGFDWGNKLFYASDYFEQLYQYAVQLIKDGKAYVCSLSTDEIREYRGNFYKPGKDSPFRNRTVEENLKLFAGMRAGNFNEGEHVLRAKIDMASPNLNMRDPLIYRIRKVTHHRTGDTWCIYPMYDFAHGLSDSIEGITHSICTLEFEDHRPLYDWFLEQLPVRCFPQQIEFAKLNLSYTVQSKRRLREFVEKKVVNGWDDPRMPTLAGMRRRGYPPAAIRNFCERIGVAKRDGVVDISLLEFAIRETLEVTAKRVMAVLNPLKVVIVNYPDGEEEFFDAPYHPEDPSWGSRQVPFSRVLYIEQDDFREDPPKKWFRLTPGQEIRLRYACLIKCVDVIKDQAGNIVEVHCTWDPESRGGRSPDGRKVKGTSHWVSAKHAIDAEVRLYDRLFTVENPMADKEIDYMTYLNPKSLELLSGCKLEPSLKTATVGETFQFERLGYFCVDLDSSTTKPVFNRTISLKDSWSKIEQKSGG